MSAKTVLKTIAMTLVSVVAASTAVSGVFVLSGRTEIGLLEAVILACGISAAISPLFLFPLIRKAHLLALATEKLDRLARTDALTGLPNRRDFYERAEALFRVRGQRVPVSVLMIDIDHFKGLNDSFGHAAGDEVLAQVADRIRRTLLKLGSGGTVVGRIGGEEFAIVLQGDAAIHAADVAASLCEVASRQPFPIGDNLYAITLSIGVEIETSAHDLDTAMRRADAAVFEAKALGRNQWTLSGMSKAPQKLSRQRRVA